MTKAAAVASLLAALLSGCGNREMNASIEKMNEGVEAYNAGQYTEAERKFAEASSLSDENHMAWYNLGQTREKLDQFKEASEAFAQAVKQKADDAMYQYRLGKALLGNDCVIGPESKIDRAQTSLEEAVKLNPRLYKAWYCLGQVYNMKDEPKLAADAWTKSAGLNAFEGDPFVALGQLYIKWDKLPQAISVLDQGRLNVKDPKKQSQILFSLGFAYEKQGNLDKAIENYSAALDKASDNLDARRQRGFAYANKGDKEKAKADLDGFVKAGGGGNAFELEAAQQRLMRMLAE